MQTLAQPHTTSAQREQGSHHTIVSAAIESQTAMTRKSALNSSFTCTTVPPPSRLCGVSAQAWLSCRVCLSRLACPPTLSLFQPSVTKNYYARSYWLGQMLSARFFTSSSFCHMTSMFIPTPTPRSWLANPHYSPSINGLAVTPTDTQCKPFNTAWGLEE